MTMIRLFKIRCIKKSRPDREKGQVLAIVLVLLLVVSMILVATLTVVGTTIKTNRIYINNTTSLYSAEAGIQDGIWNMMNLTTNELSDPLTGKLKASTSLSSPPVAYSDYDFNAEGWFYHLTDPASGNMTPIDINDYPVDITIKNVWVPLVDDNDTTVPPWVPSVTNPLPPDNVLTPPSKDKANSIVNNTKLSVSGELVTNLTYQVDIYYIGASSLPIISIGCWLPQGFTYTNGSSNLQGIYATEQVLSCAGNEAVVWTFPSGMTFNSLLSSLHESGSLAIQFNYVASNTNKIPDAVGWIQVTPNADFPYAYTWNANVKVHDLIADAGNTEIEAYLPTSGVRTLGSAIAGDYVATGGSILVDNDNDGSDLRETKLPSSSSTVSSLSTNATVEGAYLYWAGWMRGDGTGGMTATPYYDPSVTFQPPSGSAQTITADPTGDPLIHRDDIIWYDEVRSARSGTITITQGSKNVTGVGTSFSSDINAGDKISPNGTDKWYSVASKTDNTHLTLTANADFTYTGVNYSVFDGYYYACKTNVTDIVRHYSTGADLTADPPVYGNGNGTYTISNLYADTSSVQHPVPAIGDSAYAGWSLIIIYSDANTTGHQLYLFDEFRSIQNLSGNNLLDISGFITPNKIATEPLSADAVKLTVFVGEGDKHLHPDHVGLFDQAGAEHWLWDGVTDDTNDTKASPNDAFNGESLNLNAPGVDIDTYHIAWSDNIVKAGDVSAKINIYTNGDGLVSIYVIASFRSEITSGGSISYLIRKRPPPP